MATAFATSPRPPSAPALPWLTLTFHGLGEPPEWVPECERKYWVPVAWFEQILDVVSADGVGITFDDGNVSDVEHALPALEQRGMTARFFPVAGRIGAEGYVSAHDIATLGAAGMNIGSHGLHHRNWRKLTDAELREELTVSCHILTEILDTDIIEAACPFGSYNRRVLRELRAAGYRRVFNSDGDPGLRSSLLVSRTTVDCDQPLAQWLDLTSTGGEAQMSTRAHPILLGKRLLRRLR